MTRTIQRRFGTNSQNFLVAQSYSFYFSGIQEIKIRSTTENLRRHFSWLFSRKKCTNSHDNCV